MTIKIEPFEYSVKEVVASKMDLLADGGPFYFLRKGEAQGAVEVASYAINLVQTYLSALDGVTLPEAAEILSKAGLLVGASSASAVALNKTWQLGLKQLDSFFTNLDETSKLVKRLKEKLNINPETPSLSNGFSDVLPTDIRIICNRDSENEKAIPMLHALGARIRHRHAPMNGGTHRFHLSNQRCAMYYKTTNNRYIGLVSNDVFLREKLKADFEEEWNQCGPDVN